MPQSSPRLTLPYLQPSQAQKHVTHNEALRQLDMIVQLSVGSVDATEPPDSPDQGEAYAIGANPTGDWVGQAGKLATWLDSAWHFVSPGPGWKAWDEESKKLKIWSEGSWIDPPSETKNLDGIGIATSYDSTNRLSVRSPATLLSHEGGGHQLKINKAASPDTASLLFQSNWTGHAEMGLAGDTGFSIKVSPDGSNWTDALKIDPSDGAIGGSGVQSDPTDVTPGRLMRADFGYGPGNLVGSVAENSGVPGGAAIERGVTQNGEYVRLADGTQICWFELSALSCTTPEGALFSSHLSNWEFPKEFATGTTPAISGHGGSVTRFVGIETPSHTQVDLKVLSVSSDVAAVSPTLVAVGRWF